MKPKVTIGICARNSEDIIGIAIESVVQQDFPHELMELIFVDDGSEDATLKKIQEYVSKMDIPARIFSGGWRGLGKARNTIIDSAQGDYIIWLDSDEIFEKDFVRKQVDLMERNPKVGIGTARVGILPRENIILALDLIPPVVEYGRQDWTRKKLPGTGGATYRVKAAKQVGGFNEELQGFGEDIDLANRIRQAGWLILRGNAIFYERHGELSTWKALWTRYFNYGIQSRKFSKANAKIFSLYRMNPFASFIAGLRYTFLGYRLTKLKVAVLLPFHYTFKMLAWFYGFSKGSP